VGWFAEKLTSIFSIQGREIFRGFPRFKFMTLSIPEFKSDDPQLAPGEGWHCSHFFYKFDRSKLAKLSSSELSGGREAFCDILDPAATGQPQRLRLGLVSGHKADFSLMLMDPDPIKLEMLNQRLLASPLGVAIEPSYSFVSISEISEYVQSVEQYGSKLQEQGESAESSSYQAKMNSYRQRLDKMNYQRLTPDFPDWPVSCFYPMNKWRLPRANWFQLPASERHRLMSEHARSGIKFAGKVTQLITVGIGLDDWEWGVTLWATNPLHLKQIVYEMRFDEASAKYAEFGPFLTSYKMNADQLLKACCM